MDWHQILNLLYFILFFHSPFLHTSCLILAPMGPRLPGLPPLAPCPLDLHDALLHFMNSFVIDSMASPSDCPMLSRPRTKSWNKGVDCCFWDGVTCDDDRNSIIILDLSCSWLRGSLHPNISFIFPKLDQLMLSYNSICGEIPRWYWGMNHNGPEILDLSHNRLEGGIQHLHEKRLFYLDLGSNDFTGEIPSSICQLSSLLSLFLENNHFSGNVPPCFGNITNLADLSVSNNKLKGTLPRSLVKLVLLMSLNLSHNEFNDIFPHWLNASLLIVLDLQSNKFHGEINITAFGLAFGLTHLFLCNNNFTGRLPVEIFSNTSLSVIDLSNNKFEGPIPLPFQVIYYSIASNNFTGKIPYLFCNATEAMVLDLHNNSLTGSLPRCLTILSEHLEILNLRMNHLEGTIPKSFPLRNNLLTLDLSRNWIEGTLPRSLIKCENLEVLDVSDNQIKDTFPRWLGTLPKLKVLILRSNHFEDLLNIPKGAHLFPMLHILDLSNNNFGGPLPANLMMNLKSMMNGDNGQNESLYMTQSRWLYENSVTVRMKGVEMLLVKILTIFTTIDLSNNYFHGDIPGVIRHLKSLIGLNLSHNNFTGHIPPTMGNLTNLGWLDLSSNKLSGAIPRKLGDLTFLGYLNLSNNQLTGRIPQDQQLSTFSNNSFGENLDLCGTPLSKACLGDAPPPLPSSSSIFYREGCENWFKQKVLWIGYASGIVIGISIAYIAFETRRPKWLMQGVRMLERRAAKWMEKPKRKAIKFLRK